MPGETILGEKPYSFVPIPNQKPEKASAVGHDSFNNKLFSGKITVRLTALSPIHIFSGDYYEENGKVIKASATRQGLPIIPGSSLKGVLRSICEAVSFSCSPRVPDRSLEAALPTNNKYQCSDRNALCPSCRIFGFMSNKSIHKSQVKIGEFSLEKGDNSTLEIINLPSLNQPFRNYNFAGKYKSKNLSMAIGYGNERLYYCLACTDVTPDKRDKCLTCKKGFYLDLVKKPEASNRQVLFRGRKFYYHGERVEKGPQPNRRANQPHQCVKAGVSFNGEILVENLSRQELALLAFGLGGDGSYCHKIGYAKPAYLGSVKLEIIKVETLGARYGIKNEIAFDLQALAKEYGDQQGGLASAIRELRRILDWEKPKGKGWVDKDGFRIY